MSSTQGCNRRDFLKTVSAGAAIGAGLALGPEHDAAEASVASQEPASAWGVPWRPESPKRLSDTVHALARRALAGEHGAALRDAEFGFGDVELRGLSADLRYAQACRAVAENAPLRILPHEKIVGSATLREGAMHRTPVLGTSSTSHTTLGFDRVLKEGYNGLRRRIAERRAQGGFETFEPGRVVVEEGGAPLFRADSAGRYWAEAESLPEFDAPPLTVECRVRLHAKDRFNILAANHDKGTPNHWEFYTYLYSGNLSAYIPGCTPEEIVSNRDITDGQWHDVAMVWTEDRVRLYVDGEEVANQAVTRREPGAANPSSLFIGGCPNVQHGCHGEIAELRISRTARTIGADPAPRTADADTLGLWRPVVSTMSGGRVVLADGSARRNDAFCVLTSNGDGFLQAMEMCLDAAEIWRRRHIEALDRLAAESTGEERDNYLAVRATLERVPKEPPRTFREAVQALWFAFAFQRLMGTWSGIGRIDEMLAPYLKQDLAESRITLDEAREVLAHFWVKGCEWVGVTDPFGGSGDGQHYQNIILAGIDAEGREVTNEVTYLVLDVVEELHICDFPIAVRVNRNTPRELLRRVAEVQRHGGGIVAFYNEEVVIEGLVKLGYPIEEARCFTNDGCWEVLIPGKTMFAYVPFDALVLLNEVLGVVGEGPAPEYPDFDSLYAAYMARLAKHVEWHQTIADGFGAGGPPSPLVSLLVDDCIGNARGYYHRGATYYALAPHAGRLANVANSLLVLQRLVYQDGYLRLPEFVDILRNDWEGQEALRQLVRNRFAFYGNDDDEADAMMRRVFDDYTALVAQLPERNGVLRPCGISTFGREIGWSMDPQGGMATADGHHRGAVLATNFSPSPGTDLHGPTAVLKSYCKMDFTRTPSGATLELKLHPESVKGERGVEAMVALMRTFQKLGGWFLHVDVVDSAMLIDAQRHPERYPNLSVRISGWSARFASMNKHWQDMVIQRTQQYV